jgi:hypothetical protein
MTKKSRKNQKTEDSPKVSASENALTEATERLYLAFAKYQKPHVLDSAPSRDANQILRGLNSAPLRQLANENLGGYPAWAMTTVGDVEEYKHYLPRIIELGTKEDLGILGTAPSELARKLLYGDFWDWDDEEKEAIQFFYRAAFSCMIEGSVYVHRHWDCCECLADLKIDVTPILESAGGHDDISKCNRALFVVELVSLAEDQKKDIALSQIDLQWLLTNEAANKMLFDGLDASSESDHWEISQAFDRLQSLRKTHPHVKE